MLLAAATLPLLRPCDCPKNCCMAHASAETAYRIVNVRACADYDDDDELLRKRLEDLTKREEAEQAQQMAQLQRRMGNINTGDAQERALYAAGVGNLPVICLDALVPRQRMELDTDDPTFCRLLRDTGLGGLLVLTSLNPAQRKVRRSGVIVRVALVDADQEREGVPTAVRASLVGRRRVRIIGPAEGLSLRVGRMRRGYDDYTSDPALGWGVERFVNRPQAAGSELAEAVEQGLDQGSAASGSSDASMQHTVWSSTRVTVLSDADEAELYEAGSACAYFAQPPEQPPELQASAAQLAASLARWLELARNKATYDDIRVTCGARAQHGAPGLCLDPDVLFERLLEDLGPQPSPTSPTALALWAAALINPLPSLGVAPECRGAVLEAACAADRVSIVQRAVDRSIRNLEGEVPLI